MLPLQPPIDWVNWKINYTKRAIHVPLLISTLRMLKSNTPLFLPCAERLAGVCFVPEPTLDVSRSWSEFTKSGDDMLKGTEVWRPFIIWGVVELFSSETRPVLFVFRCGSLGVAVSHGKPSNSVKPSLFKPAGGVPWKGLVNCTSLFSGVCKKLLSRGEDGEWGRLATCGGELNEKFAKSFLAPSSEGVPLLLGVSGVSNAGSLVRLVLKSPSVLDPGVTWRKTTTGKTT